MVHLLGTNKLNLSLYPPCEYCPVYIGLDAVELDMGFIVFCHLLESLYTFSSSETLHGVLCWRTSWCFLLLLFFFFRLLQRLTYSIGAIYHCVGPVGGFAEWRTAVLMGSLYFQKSLSLTPLRFFFLNELWDCLRSSTHRPLK